MNKIKERYRKLLGNKKNYRTALNSVLERIKFLERIFQTGGLTFSKEFCDSAVKEHNKLCLESSALYSLIREVNSASYSLIREVKQMEEIEAVPFWEGRSVYIHRLEQTITALNNTESWLVDDVYKGDKDIMDIRADFYLLRGKINETLRKKEYAIKQIEKEGV